MDALTSEDLERFIGRYSLGEDSNPFNTTDSRHFLRIKVPGGFLHSKQLRRIAELTELYSRGQAEITTRQSIQLHWIRADDALKLFSTLDGLGFTTDMCGQGFRGARYGDPRNIVCCPASGIERRELLNGAPLLQKLNDFFVGNPDFLDMPRKFKFSISGCGCDCTRAVTNDLALIAVKKDGTVGYTLLAGGSVGVSLPGPRLAMPLGIFVRPEDAFDVAVASIEIHRDYGNRESKAKARFKWLLHRWGIQRFLDTLTKKIGRPLEEYGGPVFLRNGGHEGIQPQRQEGYHSVNVPLLGGGLSSDAMISLAKLADEYGSGALRLTPLQNIIIPHVSQKRLLSKRLTELGFCIDGSKLRWESMGCASNFCGKTITPHAKDITTEIVDHLERRFSHESLNEAEFRIHVSGCPNNCCANLIAEIGLTGRLNKDAGGKQQNYDILLGGGFGTKPSLGRLVEKNVSPFELKFQVASLLVNYFERRRPLERLGDFCRRSTIEDLKQYLSNPSIGGVA